MAGALPPPSSSLNLKHQAPPEDHQWLVLSGTLVGILSLRLSNKQHQKSTNHLQNGWCCPEAFFAPEGQAPSTTRIPPTISRMVDALPKPFYIATLCYRLGQLGFHHLKIFILRQKA
jgi:hypothetical protein